MLRVAPGSHRTREAAAGQQIAVTVAQGANARAMLAGGHAPVEQRILRVS